VKLVAVAVAVNDHVNDHVIGATRQCWSERSDAMR
jgi:hypothetical protein